MTDPATTAIVGSIVGGFMGIIIVQDLHCNSKNFVGTYNANYTTAIAGTDIGADISHPA